MNPLPAPHGGPRAAPPIRLLLVDDHPVMRAGLANLLAMSGDFTVVGQADDGPTALRLWSSLAPDVCLLDVSMAGMDGIETLRRLREADPVARVLMLTSSEAAEDLQGAAGEPPRADPVGAQDLRSDGLRGVLLGRGRPQGAVAPLELELLEGGPAGG